MCGDLLEELGPPWRLNVTESKNRVTGLEYALVGTTL